MPPHLPPLSALRRVLLLSGILACAVPASPAQPRQTSAPGSADLKRLVEEDAGAFKTFVIQNGISFVPLLKGTGDPSEGRCLYWNFPNIWEGEQGPGIAATCTIRQGDWKLIYFYADRHKELYNLKEDISEKHNLAAEHPDLVRHLSKELGEFLRSVDAQRPSFKATGEPVPWPDE